MLHHIVLFKFKDGLSHEQRQQFQSGLDRLLQEVPGIISLSHGRNFSERSQGYEYGLSVHLQDQAALKAYQDHPIHQEVLTTTLRPLSQESLAVDYEYDS